METFVVNRRLARPVILSLICIFLFSACEKRKEAYNVPRCSEIWNGIFYNAKDGRVNTEIERDGDVQIERHESGAVVKLKVEWLDSCRYRLTQISANSVGNARPISVDPVIVQITSVTKEAYDVDVWLEGSSLSTYKSSVLRRKPKR